MAEVSSNGSAARPAQWEGEILAALRHAADDISAMLGYRRDAVRKIKSGRRE